MALDFFEPEDLVLQFIEDRLVEYEPGEWSDIKEGTNRRIDEFIDDMRKSNEKTMERIRTRRENKTGTSGTIHYNRVN